jgi:hypothetical protein
LHDDPVTDEKKPRVIEGEMLPKFRFWYLPKDDAGDVGPRDQVSNFCLPVLQVDLLILLRALGAMYP